MFTGLENPLHWLIIAIVALVVFGPKRLPELGRSLGSGLRGFRESLSGHDDADEPQRPAATVAAPDDPAPSETPPPRDPS